MPVQKRHNRLLNRSFLALALTAALALAAILALPALAEAAESPTISETPAGKSITSGEAREIGNRVDAGDTSLFCSMNLMHTVQPAFYDAASAREWWKKCWQTQEARELIWLCERLGLDCPTETERAFSTRADGAE